jgi:hypothetical protein
MTDTSWLGPPIDVRPLFAGQQAKPSLRAQGPAAAGDGLGPPWDRGKAVEVPLLASAPVERVIAARGSQRRMDASRGLSQDLLRTCMSVALRGLCRPARPAPRAGSAGSLAP